ncbi:cytochrome d ubiquinol oxidase subunit II [Geotalea sp. SG265]|uniref:cytochrome d ubiquinol oxidase subunit II n=1 Tax=Geotalea sp. SG265 TaxID=2922867 RepID=UPI001FAF6FD4|nr:cytochrome d ubiquinol oxidase subunit II [Geotalea sp. SG265]
MELQVTWFVLWAVLWAVYFMLDGFVIGTGMLHGFLGRSDGERRVLINTIGPVWDGNEVWLITAGGATFAAFPTTYALMFSYLYTALLLLLFALIVRGVSFEFRSKEESVLWRRSWDYAIPVSSFLLALLFGVAFGNIFAGLPMDATGYHGSLLYLLNPYGLLTGVLFVLLFMVHGSLYVAIKTTGELSERARVMTARAWPALAAVAVVFLAYTKQATQLYNNYFKAPVLFLIPVAAVAAMIVIRIELTRRNPHKAFVASCVTVIMIVATGVAGLFPNLIPSSLDPAYSLAIFNTSSSPYTLKIMTLVVVLFLPIVIAYKIWVYRVFHAPVTVESVLEDKQSY